MPYAAAMASPYPEEAQNFSSFKNSQAVCNKFGHTAKYSYTCERLGRHNTAINERHAYKQFENAFNFCEAAEDYNNEMIPEHVVNISDFSECNIDNSIKFKGLT